MWRTSIVVKFELEFTKFNSGQGQMWMAFLWVRFTSWMSQLAVRVTSSSEKFGVVGTKDAQLLKG